MRLVTYFSVDGPRAGLLTGDGVIDAWKALGEPARANLRELIAEARVADLGRVGTEAVDLTEFELLPPIPDPEKIVCIGLNYRTHAAEAGHDPPDFPTIFGKYRNALAAPGSTVLLPRSSAKVDYEAEVAFVVGRRAKEVDVTDALDHIVGYTLLNDLSARDLQFSTPQWMAGKVFDGSAPCGPAIVTPDEAGRHDAIAISLTLNGETMQSATTADLIFSVPELLAHLSTLMTLEPGDIVATGTPAGVGGAREPRVWLGDGDEVIVSSPTLGTLETRISR
jgi:2-keto-4-pentenoate hydratase/2-oxohepta-3-ene-1,7-dioic acid hydratase in catechol pathway